MVKAVHLLCDLWAEFLIPSSVSEWKFNPTCLSHFTFFHFWENILKFSLDFSQLRFIACPWGRPCWFPLQIFSQSKSEISFSNKCSVFFQMKKGESWGWMILSSVGICSACVFKYYTVWSEVKSLSRVRLFATPWTPGSSALKKWWSNDPSGAQKNIQNLHMCTCTGRKTVVFVEENHLPKVNNVNPFRAWLVKTN